MREIILEIHQALSWGFNYLAVTTALTLPDICGSLESADGRASSSRFKAWCDAWFIPRGYDGWMTAEDLYQLRCGIVHQGRMGTPKMQYNRVGFVTSEAIHRFVSSNNGGVPERMLLLSASIFSRDMTDGVAAWQAAKGNDPNVVANLALLLRNRPNGVPPHVVGMPVIA